MVTQSKEGFELFEKILEFLEYTQAEEVGNLSGQRGRGCYARREAFVHACVKRMEVSHPMEQESQLCRAYP